jgi:hypothetical protein
MLHQMPSVTTTTSQVRPIYLEVSSTKLPVRDFPFPFSLAAPLSCSRNPCHSSAKLSLLAGLLATPPPAGPSGKYSPPVNAGVLGVRCTSGECGGGGGRRLAVIPLIVDEEVEVVVPPGRARPACSRCSSVQPRRAAMSWRIWNFLGSERSRARKWRRWLVMIWLFWGKGLFFGDPGGARLAALEGRMGREVIG